MVASQFGLLKRDHEWSLKGSIYLILKRRAFIASNDPRGTPPKLCYKS
jgi:hypothetical protein